MQTVSSLENQWFAIYTRSRCEKKVATELQNLGYEAWVPLLKTMRQWSDRKKKVEVPLFNSYVFIRSQLLKVKSLISKVDGAVYIVSFSGVPAIVPDKQINDLKLLLNSSEKFEISFNEFMLGEQIEVTKGALKGLQGIFVHYKGRQRILMQIDAINQKLLIDINPAFVRKVHVKQIDAINSL
jgi:transcription antitermination factor NusG